MSGFMSFATGALQEIGTQIDRYQAQRRQDELAEASGTRKESEMRIANQLEGDLRVKLKEMDHKFASEEFDRKIAAEERLRGRKLTDQEKLERMRFGFEKEKIQMQQTFTAGESQKERDLRATLSADQIAARINISDADRKSLEKRAADQIASQEKQTGQRLSQQEKNAIRDNVYRYAALDQAAVLQEKQLQSQEEIAGLRLKADKAKNFYKIGEYLEWRRDAKPDEEVKNFFQAIEANGDAFNAALNDVDTKQKTIAALRRNFGQITAGVGSFSPKRKILAGGTQTSIVAPPHLEANLRQIGVKNETVLKYARQFMKYPQQNLGTQVPPNAAAITRHGNHFSVFPEVAGLDAAVERFRKTQFSSLGMESREEIVAKLQDRLGQMSTEKYEMYIKAANSPLGSVLGAETTPDYDQVQAAQDYLYDRANGFVDDDGNLKVANFRKFIEVFGRQNETQDAPATSIAQEIKFGKIDKGDVAKDRTNTREKAESARAAQISIDSLITLISKSGSPGRIIDNIRVLKIGLPEVINSGIQIVSELMKDGNTFVDSMGQVQAKYDDDAIKLYQDARDRAISVSNDAKASERDKASALIGMYEMVLAYQITGILQGGTGGRTISDEDVKRALSMFSGSIGSITTRLEKLKSLKGLVSVAINKQEIYNVLGANKNAGIYNTAKRAFSLVKSEYTLDNFFDKIDGRAKTVQAQVTSDSASALVGTIQEFRLMGPNFNREAAFNGIKQIIADGGRGEIQTSNLPRGVTPYVFNKDAMERFRSAHEEYKEGMKGTPPSSKAAQLRKNLEKVQEEIQKQHPVVYSLQTNSFKKITYDVRTGKISIEKDVGDQGSLNVNPPTFASATSKLFNAA